MNNIYTSLIFIITLNNFAINSQILDDSYYSLGHFPLHENANDLSNYQNHGHSINIEFSKSSTNDKKSAKFSKTTNSLIKIPQNNAYNFQ